MAFRLKFDGAVVAVTGASSGIGQGIARMFARAGARVAGCGRSNKDSPGAKEFCQIVATEGGEALYVTCDIATKAGPGAFVNAVVNHWGRIDTVVSNAGRNVFTGVNETSIAEWTECMNLDLRAHWILAKSSYPALLSASKVRSPESGADIGTPSFLVNLSNHAWHSIPGCFPYNVAKAGLKGLIQSLAMEWGPDVRAVGVAPGFVETAGNQRWFDSFDRPEAERQRTVALHPTGAIGTVDQIGAIFLFLACQYADFVNGTTWLVNGGRSALMQDGGKRYITGSMDHGSMDAQM